MGKSVFYGHAQSFSNIHGRADNQWRFSYTAKELLPIAERLRKEHKAKETTARNKLAEANLDRSIKHNDEIFQSLRAEIETNGRHFETLSILIAGFKKQPQKVFELTLDDMAFFELEDSSL